MITIEGIIGLIASVFSIVAALTVTARYLGKRFDKWADALIENSRAIRLLTVRVGKLEERIKDGPTAS